MENLLALKTALLSSFGTISGTYTTGRQSVDGIMVVGVILLSGIYLSRSIKRWNVEDSEAKEEEAYQEAVAQKYPHSEIGPLPESPRYDDDVSYNWVKAAGEMRARELRTK